MTNNEIIKFLQSKQIPQCGDKVYTADEKYEAYQRAIDALEQQPIEDMPCVTPEEMQKCKDIVKKYTPKQQPSYTVSRGAFEQVMWERDVAIEQLKELGYEFGQKIEPCDDVVSRQAVLDVINTAWTIDDLDNLTNAMLTDMIKTLPPVTPQKYGKWILADEQNKEDVENDNYRFICSECQCSDIHAKGTIVPYCWKCGAKMQESE